jgi:MATE family multidrug resistance protein
MDGREGENRSFEGRERLSWERRPVAELLVLAWPIAVSMVSYAVMTLVDTLFVARLGAAQLAGMSVASVGFFTVACFGMGLLRGVKILVSQARGAGRTHRELAFVGAGLWTAIVLGVVTVAAGQLVAGALPLLLSSPDAGDAARVYLSVRVLGAPLLFGYVALREARYGAGDSRTPMYAAVAGNVVNVVLDAVFVLGFDLGIGGVAAATVTGVAVEALWMVGVQRARGFGLLAAGRQDFVALLRVGVPTGVQFVLEVGSFALLTGLLASVGDLEVAAHQIALQVIHFTFLPTVAIAESISVLAGQAVGARRLRLVPRVARAGMFVVGAYAALCSLVLVVGGRLIASAFTEDAALLLRTGQLLSVAAIFQVLDGAGVVARGTLRGAGDVKYAASVGVITAWLMTPPTTWLLGVQLGWGALGGWVGLTLEIAIGAALFWARLHRRGWLSAARRSRALSVA